MYGCQIGTNCVNLHAKWVQLNSIGSSDVGYPFSCCSRGDTPSVSSGTDPASASCVAAAPLSPRQAAQTKVVGTGSSSETPLHRVCTLRGNKESAAHDAPCKEGKGS
jgi:hypothetical protein